MRISQLLVVVAALATAHVAAQETTPPPPPPGTTNSPGSAPPPPNGQTVQPGPPGQPSPGQPGQPATSQPPQPPVAGTVIEVFECAAAQLSIGATAEGKCVTEENKKFNYLQPSVPDSPSLTVKYARAANLPNQALEIFKADYNDTLTDIQFLGLPTINATLSFPQDVFEGVVNLNQLAFHDVKFKSSNVIFRGLSKLTSLKMTNTNAHDVSLAQNASNLQTVDFSNTTFTTLPSLFYERAYSQKLKLNGAISIAPSANVLKLSQAQLQNIRNNVDDLDLLGIKIPEDCSAQPGWFVVCPSEKGSSGSGLGSAGTATSTPQPTKRAKSSSTTLIVIVAIVSAVAVVLAALVTRRYVNRGKLSRSASNNEVFIAKGDVTPKAGKLSFISSDETLRQFRLDQNDVSLTRAVGSGRLWIGELAGQKVIIKRIDAESSDSYATKALRKQAKHLATLDCPSVVRMTGVTWIQGTDFGIVAEFMEKGTLKSVLMDRETQLDFQGKMAMCIDIALALSYLHTPGRDMYMRRLSSRKVLVGASMECKLNLFECFPVTNKLDVPDVFGSGEMPWYAPELITRTAPQDARKANIFSLGVLLCEILTGKSPYQSEIDAMGSTLADMALLKRIRSKQPLQPHEECDEFSRLRPEVRELIARCLSYQPFDRPSADEVVQSLELAKQHAWQTSL
ncbi:hypothetical protein P43SY_001545 [Pythium insidiosum]|uniref:Protein kinase domain-containing protein n=1 Tax=Pythium insidiosum TaxID=114742 RepID=A0AAD5LU88_PYTIN|nr:hypothetical protein P43SY_001545 [Pythium insidiosum]